MHLKKKKKNQYRFILQLILFDTLKYYCCCYYTVSAELGISRSMTNTRLMYAERVMVRYFVFGFEWRV